MIDLQTRRAIILKYSNVSEADRLYHLFVEGRGRIVARAVGVRHMKSKLRYTLQSAELIRVSLIESKRGVRIVNAFTVQQPRIPQKEYKDVLRSFLLLIERLIQGEFESKQPFSLIDFIINYHYKSDSISDEKKSVYGTSVLMLLSSLGYYAPSPEVEEMLFSIISSQKSASHLLSVIPDPSSLIRQLIITTQL